MQDAAEDKIDLILHALGDVILKNVPANIDAIDLENIQNYLSEHWTIQNVFGDGASKIAHPQISAAFLESASKGSKGVAAATLGLPAEQPDGVSFRTKSIIAAVERGHSLVLSPFSGVAERVNHTFGQEWSLILTGNDYCLASNLGGAMVDVNLETVWVLPSLKLILWTNIAYGPREIFTATANLFRNILSMQDEVVKYLRRPSPPEGDGVSLADFHCPHMTHNLWNIRTGWNNVFANVLPSQFKSIFNYDGQNFFGSIAELFPDKVAGAAPVRYVKSDQELFVEACRNGGVTLGVKDEIILPGFPERVLARARSRVTGEFLEELARLRADCRPLVVTTLRLDNRAWIEQREGYPKLFSKLREQFPRLGVILDGLSRDTAKGWTTGWMSMADELSVAQTIREKTPTEMPVVFAVGRPFAEAILLCDAADCFIAPSGSGMTLYKWISNIPGYAFSNWSVLDETSGMSWPLRVWNNPAFRHDVAPTVHMSPELIQDGDVERDHKTRANFHLDWEVLHREATAYLNSLGFESA